MALITTFATIPLTAALYPPWYQKKLESWKRGEIDWDGTCLIPDDRHDKDTITLEKLQNTQFSRLLVNLRLDSLPSLLTLITLFNLNSSSETTPKVHPLKASSIPEESADMTEATPSIRRRSILEVHGVRMLELTERTSSVMKVSEADEYAVQDPVVNIFRTFGRLNNVAVSGGVAVIPEGSYADTLTNKASDLSSDPVLIPWSETGSVNDGQGSLLDSTENRFTSSPHNQFIATALTKAWCTTAVFVNRGFGGPSRETERTLNRTVSGLSMRGARDANISTPIVDRSHHIFFPFFGGADDRVTLRFVLQLAQNPTVTATIIYFCAPAGTDPTASEAASPPPSRTRTAESIENIKSASTIPEPSTAPDKERDMAFFVSLRDSLPSALSSRVVFDILDTTHPAREALSRAQLEVGASPKNAGDLVIVGKGAHGHFERELSSWVADDVDVVPERRKCLGDVAELMLAMGVKASVLVIKAAGKGLDV